MSLPLVVTPLAEADLIVGREWCEQRRGGQGNDFILCVEEIFERLISDPESHGKEYEDLRVASIRRYNYGVAYRVDPGQVTIIAVYHLKSNPRVWQSRV